jgi:diguanylate cyclase (GGDEF)-like protein
VTALPTDPSGAAIAPWWLRLHRGLMPDYNRKAAVYWWVMVLIGAAVLGQSLRSVLAMPANAMLQVAAGVAFALLAGLFPVRIAHSKNSFAAGEAFIFLLLLLHGPAAAALTAAGEALIGSWRTSKRWTSRLASPAIGGMAMYCAGSVLQAGIDAAQSWGVYSAALLMLASMVCAVFDFSLNTALITALPYLKRNQRPTLRELFGSFGWVGITFVGSASVACLVFLAAEQSGRGVLLVAAPIMALMLATLHYFFRQQEADETVRKSAQEAAEREAELVTAHVRELELSEAKLQHIAFHDSLTGLPNRHHFQGHLTQMLERAQADPQRQFSLMFLDFDRFKLINDSLGHTVGDEFLVAVARRIQQHLRPRDVVARLGGDEFAVLTEDLDCEAYAISLAERLLDVLRQPMHIDGHDIVTSASIGITFSGMNYSTPAEMLRDADIAMYKAKNNGKARYALFDAQLHTEVANCLRLEGELRRALAGGQLSVVYQPLFDLASGRVTGFEALARWNHPQLGAVSPATFIPVAEDAGLMVPLTDFVLGAACRQLHRWQSLDSTFASLTMHVNVSGSDIAHPSLVSRVNAALVEARLQAHHLTLELTENILMSRLEAALPALSELRRLGVGLSVDDFGAGYSSLRHLSALPVSSLKIDRSFVADMGLGSNEAALVRGIVLIGQSMGKQIVAEGIETAQQLERLRDMGCMAGQGYHLSRPLAVGQVDKMLEALVAAPPAAALAHATRHSAALLH